MKSKGKEQAAAPDGTASEGPMTSGTADCIEEVRAPDDQPSLGAAECVPGAAIGSSETKVEMAEVQEANGQEAEIQE